MERDVLKVYNSEEFARVARGIRVAQCMRGTTSSSVVKPSEPLPSLIDPSTDAASQLEPTVSARLFCSYCGVGFRDQVHQREHYKLDWHRYNLKQHLAGRAAVTEEDFDLRADRDDMSSISGSESESESESSSDEASSELRDSSRNVRAFFENDDGKIFSIYRCLLHGKKDAPEDTSTLSSLGSSVGARTKWAVLMLGGGHFAAAVFDGSTVTAHKTFHCYTVRKGQGGSQSSRDAKSGGTHPKSAGASLRRYNEAALTQHVQDILGAWSSSLAACDLVFYRASGHNAAALFAGRAAPLDRSDCRLRSVPFPTRRATFSEVKRTHDLLATVQMHGSAADFQLAFPQSPRRRKLKTSNREQALDASDLGSPRSIDSNDTVHSPRQRLDRAHSRETVDRPLPDLVATLALSSSESDSQSDEPILVYADVQSNTNDLAEFGDSLPQRVKKRVKKKPKKKQEEVSPEIAKLHRSLTQACGEGDTAGLMRTAEEAGPEDLAKCLNEQRDKQGELLLHVAAASGQVEIVRLLLEVGSDPGARNKRGQPGYAVSADKNTRNAFRRFMAEHPDKYDYSKSQIPSGLTEDLEKEQADKRRAVKAAKREKEKEKRKEEKEKVKENEEKERFLKLSDREKRALAAERRLVSQVAQGGARPPVLARCFTCAVDISGKVPFEYDIHRFCSIVCLKAHRMSHKTVL